MGEPRDSLVPGPRAGHFDTVMMLAVIHHLLLSSQIPLERISALCASLTTRNLIVEWVPPADVKFRELVRGREASCAHITEIAFREAFLRHFTIARECRLANGRAGPPAKEVAMKALTHPAMTALGVTSLFLMSQTGALISPSHLLVYHLSAPLITAFGPVVFSVVLLSAILFGLLSLADKGSERARAFSGPGFCCFFPECF